MRGFERVPFLGDPTRIGEGNSCDSIVMRLDNPSIESMVVKWNRNPIASLEEAFSIARFVSRSLALYEAVLGPEYVVPTYPIVGEKKDFNNIKTKVYLVQPLIEGWDGKSLPFDLRKNSHLLEEWRRLYSRLAILYIAGHNVNNRFKGEPEKAFPINLTMGSSRKMALYDVPAQSLHELPTTPNLLIAKDLRLKVCDLGRYTPWSDDMQGAYEEIFNRSTQALTALEGF